jgi:hypothetical protein
MTATLRIIRVDRYDMIDPRVQLDGDVAVLTFNLMNYLTDSNGIESLLNRWNSTEGYRRVAASGRSGTRTGHMSGPSRPG